MKIYIYGRGLGLAYVKRCIQDGVEIISYIDNYAREDKDENGVSVIKEEGIEGDFDYIIISLMVYDEIKKQLISRGVPEEKIICFFNMKDVDRTSFGSVIDTYRWKTELMWKYDREYVEPLIDNIFYEINVDVLLKQERIPYIESVEATIDAVINGRKSLVRFGDGEFEMIRKQTRPRFQSVNENLANRLREIIKSTNSDVLVCVADNYGSLTEYTDEAAAAIRRYLSPDVRKDHMKILDTKRKYGNAYLSRPYYMFRDKTSEMVKKKFEHIKKIWSGEDLLIVEGEHTRFGIGNDLLSKAGSVRRLLVPDRNAFSVYDEILRKAKMYAEKRLVLCIIGPTATVLSYDLAIKGIRAIDIGQVDSEYEWFLRDAPNRCDVPYKTVSEYVDKTVFAELDWRLARIYEKEIIDTVLL